MLVLLLIVSMCCLSYGFLTGKSYVTNVSPMGRLRSPCMVSRLVEEQPLSVKIADALVGGAFKIKPLFNIIVRQTRESIIKRVMSEHPVMPHYCSM